MITLLFLLGAIGDDVLIADFEGKDYGAWTTTETAFGAGPAQGSLPDQMKVSGYLGEGLVNSLLGGDAATGTLSSPAFTVERKAINFLIGGGHHPNETCINLRIDRKVVRTSTGRDSEHLEWDSWDVAEFAGKQATLEIVDQATGGWGHINVDHIVQSDTPRKAEPQAREIAVAERYLHLPVRTGAPKRRMKILDGSAIVREFEIELADGEPQFWAQIDVAAWKGKTLRLEVQSTPGALDSVGQGAGLKGEPLYEEKNRPQFHFTSRRGWLNDPNGLVWNQGEYHLYYQHNPYGWAWGNMHWGHAVSKDLLHWEELPIAIYPAKFGDWAFSGSAVVDSANTSGFKTGADDVLVGAYTSTGRGECIVYSNDRGRTWTEYAGNPVVKHQGRDPRLLWHAASKQWVMAVYHEAGKTQSIQFHTSADLKTWTYRSIIDGFYECPDLFELPVDGGSRWVLLAADGRYLLGQFDGKEFKPEGEKHTLWHGAFYAAQTVSQEPGGRRVQIGWARGTDFPGMPFNQQMNVPVELTLKSTPEGLQMFAWPVKEVESLRGGKLGADALSTFDADSADLELAFRPGSAQKVELMLAGLPVVYDAKKQELSSKRMVVPLQPVDGVVRLRALVDRGSVEIFGSGGRVAWCIPSLGRKGWGLSLQGGDSRVESLELWPLRSAWK